jgi:predicted RNA-binding protein (virulence factor B family)
MQEGKSYIVYVSLDNEGRVMASAKIDKFLDEWPVDYKVGEAVNLLIADRTDLGIKAIINNRHWGLLYKEDIFKSLRHGKKVKGFIKNIRDDDKIDLVLSQPGYEKVVGLAGRILAELEKNDGFLPLHDKSPPEQIKHMFGESKKTFKNAIGDLYKQQKIDISKDGIRIKK